MPSVSEKVIFLEELFRKFKTTHLERRVSEPQYCREHFEDALAHVHGNPQHIERKTQRVKLAGVTYAFYSNTA